MEPWALMDPWALWTHGPYGPWALWTWEPRGGPGAPWALHWTTHPSQGLERIAKCLGLFILGGESCIWIHREWKSLGAFWDRCVVGFGWNFAFKEEPSWHQNRWKIGLGGLNICLGMSLQGSWNCLGGQNRKPRRWLRFWEASWGRLGVFLASKRKPRASKKRSKNRSKFNSMLGSFFGKVLVGFGRQGKAKLAPKSIQNLC